MMIRVTESVKQSADARVQMRGVVIRHDGLRPDYRGRGRRGTAGSDALAIVTEWAYATPRARQLSTS